MKQLARNFVITFVLTCAGAIAAHGQIIFRSSATPGHIPAISPSHTLMDSPFSVGGDGSVAMGGLSIDSSGIIKFADKQNVLTTLNGQTGDVGMSGTNGLSVSANAGTVTVTSNATTDDIPGTIVSRDSFGDITANTILLDGNIELGTTFSPGALYLGMIPFLYTHGTRNTFVGAAAGNMTMTGHNNSAFGPAALQVNSTGSSNSAFGNQTLEFNQTGSSNSAFGDGALLTNTSAVANSAFGALALLSSNGDGNVAVGENALSNVRGGSFNIALGTHAGDLLGGSENNNIDIGNEGRANESNAIHIGTVGTQTTASIAGVFNSASAFGIPVLINSFGQLGTNLSSKRYKEKITTMNAESDVLMKLRPVSFYYRPEYDSSHTRQYGLVAEEVAKIAPDLVLFDEDGNPQTVRYHFVNAMLLNEVQKQKRLIGQQEKQLRDQQLQIDRLNATLKSQQAAQQAELKELLQRLAALEKSVRPETQLASAK